MFKKMKKNELATALKVVLVVALIAAGGGIYLYSQVNSYKDNLKKEQEQKELLDARIKEVEAQLGVEREEKESLAIKLTNAISDKEVVFDAGEVTSKLKDIGELATVEYDYTDVGSCDSHLVVTGTSWQIPFTQKTVVVSMDGIIKVGVDVEQIKIESDELTKTITVKVPKAKILSHELDEDSFTVYDEKNSIFNKVTLQDSADIRKEIKTKAEQKVKEKDLYTQAQKRAGDTVKYLIESIPYIKDKYTIVVK